MIFFFDRDIGVSLPRALLELRFDRQFNELHYHQQIFRIDEKDDTWMPQVGRWGWTIVGHDSQHHAKPNEVSAIKQYGIGCFYLWGAEAKRWEKMQCFARAYNKIVREEARTPRPFIYIVTKQG